MPRNLKLSWQQPAKGSGRAGRWRRKYKGKVYYFPGGRGKSDREAYDAAMAAWEAMKFKIDREAPRPHQRDHEMAIDQWEQVLAWCSQYGDRKHSAVAAEKLENLRKRLAAPILRPLDRNDWFEAIFDDPLFDAKSMVEIEKILNQTLAPPARDRTETFDGPSERTTEETEAIKELVRADELLGNLIAKQPANSRTRIQPLKDWDLSPLKIEKEVWRDRLEIQRRQAASEDDSLHAHVERFLKEKQVKTAAGEISVGRHYALKLHLTQFQDFLGKDTAVGTIDGAVLKRYYAGLLDKVASKIWRRTTASHYLTSVKSFVRWLWYNEAIPALPRIMAAKSEDLKISKPRSKVITFTKEEVKLLLARAPERTKLYILLMLNIGATQKDISDLLVSEVNWVEGRIVRRRSKTSNEENVPEVNYKLWPMTLRLLRQERAVESKDRVLRNSNGTQLWSEEMTANGKYKKNDNIKSAFARLSKNVGIAKPLKSLKKTSATLLRGDERYSALAGLFLGHAPQTMSDRHYTQVPQGLLDDAILWLGQQYNLAEPLEKKTSQKKNSRRRVESKSVLQKDVARSPAKRASSQPEASAARSGVRPSRAAIPDPRKAR